VPKQKVRRRSNSTRGAGVLDLVQQLQTVRDTMARFEQREAEIKERLKTVIEADGEVDSKGSVWLELNGSVQAADGKMITKLKHERRVSQAIDPDEAERILRAKDMWDECTRMEVVLDEDAVLAAGYEKKLTAGEMKKIITEKVSYAFKML
jgi:hypothetical protein